MPGYIRFLADRDEAERLILSFYGSLAHGMTRGTFISGEGDTLGAHPDYNCRSSYGSYCSANNTSKLLALRQMLVRESFDSETGLPTGLYMCTCHAATVARSWTSHSDQGCTDRIRPDQLHDHIASGRRLRRRACGAADAPRAKSAAHSCASATAIQAGEHRRCSRRRCPAAGW